MEVIEVTKAETGIEERRAHGKNEVWVVWLEEAV